MPRHLEMPTRGQEAERLRRLREHAGFSQRELADEFHVTSGAIAQWENQARTIPGPVLKLLSLYEREFGLAGGGARRRAGPPIDRVTRNLKLAGTATAWLFLAQFTGEGTSA